MSIIVAAGGAVTALAAKAATSTVPIVAIIGDDPVKSGLISNLVHPGSNITGVTLFVDALMTKRLELMDELLPSEAVVLLNPQNPNAESEAKSAREASLRSGRELRMVTAGTPAELETTFANLSRMPRISLIIETDPFFFAARSLLTEVAARYEIPAIYFHRLFALSGGLISYGATFTEEHRLAGVYAWTYPIWRKAGKPAISAAQQGRASR